MMNKQEIYNTSLGDNKKCLHCGLSKTPEQHDGCVGTLENVKNACCGHGVEKEAYVQFNHKDYDNKPNKVRIAGKEAIEYIKANKNIALVNER